MSIANSGDGIPHIVGTPEIERRVRRAIHAAIRQAGGYEAVASRIGQSLGIEIAASRLREFTRSAARKRVTRFPLAWLPAFCESVGCWSLLREILPDAMRSALVAAERITDSKRALLKAVAAIEALEDRHPKARRRGRN